MVARLDYARDESDGVIRRTTYDPAEPRSVPSPTTYTSSSTPTPTPTAPAANTPAPGYQPNPLASRAGYDTGSYRNVVNMLAANKGRTENFANGLANGLINKANAATTRDQGLALGKQFSLLTRNPVATFASQQGGGYTAGAGRLDNYFLGATPGAMNALRAAQGQYSGIMARLGNAPAAAPTPTPTPSPTPSAPPPPTPQPLPTYKTEVIAGRTNPPDSDPNSDSYGLDAEERQRRIEGRNRGGKEIY